MSILNQMISNVLETRFETIPSDVIKRAKDEVIDVIGCALGGANDTGCPEILALMQEWGGAAESTILAHGFKAPSHNVAFINTVMARSFDFGIVDAYMEGEVKPAHIGETLVPTALAIAEARALTGKQLLTSLVLGEDLTSRIMFSSGSPGSWDFTGTLNTFGSTAVAGRLLGLNPIQLVDAFGIALNQIGGSAQNLNEKVHCFKL